MAAYVYDEADHGAGIGRLSRVSYTAGTLWYNYDISGNVIDEYRQIDLMVTGRSALGSPPIGAYHVGRTYDYLGRLATLTYPDGEVVSHGYDAAGRLYSVGSYVTAATYDARDNLTSRTLGNGVVETFAYHPNRFWLTRSTASKGSALHDVSYGRNSRGEVTSRQNALLAEDAWTYGYDDLRRLTTSAATGNSAWSQSFSYDPIGRILSQSGTGAYTYAGPGAGPLHGPATVNGAAVTYNANGQMTSGMGVTQVSYDLQGRVNYADGSNYTYDHAGELVSSTESRYMSGLFEINKSTGVSTNYISFEDARVARKRAGAIVFYHGDQVGSVSAITDGAGAVVQRNVFSPFGKLLWQAGSLADNPFGLAAQRAEPSGLYHMGARRMSPIAGMFISPDPSNAPDPLQPQTLNRFAYTRNSPINLVDPTGYADEGAANGESRWRVPKWDVPQWLGKLIAGSPSEDTSRAQMQHATVREFKSEVDAEIRTAPEQTKRAANTLLFALAFSPVGEVGFAEVAVVREGSSLIGSMSAETKIFTLESRAASLSERAGANSVTVRTLSGQIRYDLRGASHYSKVEGVNVPTPHVQEYTNNIIPSGPRAGQVGSVTPSGYVRSATSKDLRIVNQVLDKRAK